MGGDPTGERSDPSRMLLLCNWRHKEDRFSIDKRGIRWEPMTDAGANGPVAWFVDVGRLSGSIAAGEWVEVAREVRPGVLAGLSNQQLEILGLLESALIRRFR